MDGRAALAMTYWLRRQTDFEKTHHGACLRTKIAQASSAAKPPSGSKRLFRKISRVGPVHSGRVTE